MRTLRIMAKRDPVITHVLRKKEEKRKTKETQGTKHANVEGKEMRPTQICQEKGGESGKKKISACNLKASKTKGGKGVRTTQATRKKGIAFSPRRGAEADQKGKKEATSKTLLLRKRGKERKNATSNCSRKKSAIVKEGAKKKRKRDRYSPAGEEKEGELIYNPLRGGRRTSQKAE